jgi:hypothetical protein
MMKGMMDAISLLAQNKKEIDKSCRPVMFKGQEGKYHEWMLKLQSSLRTKYEGSDEWLRWAMTMVPSEQGDILDAKEENIKKHFGENGKKVEEFSKNSTAC